MHKLNLFVSRETNQRYPRKAERERCCRRCGKVGHIGGVSEIRSKQTAMIMSSLQIDAFIHYTFKRALIQFTIYEEYSSQWKIFAKYIPFSQSIYIHYYAYKFAYIYVYNLVEKKVREIYREQKFETPELYDLALPQESIKAANMSYSLCYLCFYGVHIKLQMKIT